MPRLSISTWSLHNSLGGLFYEGDPERGALTNKETGEASLDLLDLPEHIADAGINTLEVCHFHFPRTDGGYLTTLREACDAAGVELYSLLIDKGDVSHPDASVRKEQIDFTAKWLRVAGRLGVKGARVDAGDSEISPDAIKRSAESLRELAKIGRDVGVQVFTENWKKLTRRSAPVLEILERCDGKIGLCADFGNFKGDTKYADLAAIAPKATSCHAKANWPDDEKKMDQADFDQCMSIMRDAKFDGPMSVIYDSGGDEMSGIRATAKAMKQYL